MSGARILVGMTVLLGLFGLAALWHSGLEERLARELHSERAARESGRAGASGMSGDWAREDWAPEDWAPNRRAIVVLGRPSGADPVARPAPAEDSPERSDEAAERRADSPEDAPTNVAATRGLAEEDFHLTLRPGQVLSQIAAEYYGTSHPELVQNLARYNGLESPHRVRAGAEILLPPKAKLLGTDDRMP